jgi:hypothetical protein
MNALPHILQGVLSPGEQCHIVRRHCVRGKHVYMSLAPPLRYITSVQSAELQSDAMAWTGRVHMIW